MSDIPNNVKPETARILGIVVRTLEDAKAEEIHELDVRQLTDITDFMVVASGTSHRHVNAMAERVREAANEQQWHVIGVEGEAENDWVLLDYGDLVVHLMMPQTREFYDLEGLWDVRLGKLMELGRDTLLDH
jgi:ribosome-associated protein|tara:strand:+ start:110 stop:505 length:396 start_codon:yes stop_codon:yes gene_type:complete